jgi:hypothetical protein
MTQFIYIASPFKLPKGAFGLQPLSSEQKDIFKQELDFTHLYFENNNKSKLLIVLTSLLLIKLQLIQITFL